MNRIGPFGNGDCSRSYTGTLALRGEIRTVEVDCWVDPKNPPRGVPTLKHGGSANLAYRDGKLIALGNGHLKVLDGETLAEQRQIRTVVTGGFQGWDRTNGTKARTQAGHSVPAGLSTLYWLENGLVSIRPGGDIGSNPNGHEFVRVSGEAAIPQLRRESNQREWLAVCDGNPLILCSMGGHTFGRTIIDGVRDGAGMTIRVPNVVNAPSHISTQDCHYLLFPAKLSPQARNKSMLEHTPGLSVYRVDASGNVSQKFVNATMGVWTGWDGTYAPQPWCLSKGWIYAVTGTKEVSAIDVSTWGFTKFTIPPSGFRPRLAVNQSGVAVVCGLGQIFRVGAWSFPVPLDGESMNTNKQFCNHIVIDDENVYLGRLLSGQLVIDARKLNGGSTVGRHVVPIPGSDVSGQCHDMFAADGALYALVTPREPPISGERRFSQMIVRVA